MAVFVKPEGPPTTGLVKVGARVINLDQLWWATYQESAPEVSGPPQNTAWLYPSVDSSSCPLVLTGDEADAIWAWLVGQSTQVDGAPAPAAKPTAKPAAHHQK